MWGVIFALQGSRAVHLGIDNLGVVRHVGRLLDGCRGAEPFELVNDGDLLLLIDRMLRRRGLDTVRISKVKGHADDSMILHGQVRREDKLGNDAADEAADFGRRRVSPAVIDARRNLSGVCGRWYPVVLDLHRSSLLDAAGDWDRKGSYHTAWSVPCDSVPCDSSCTCSYAYGQGPAIGPHTGHLCWPLLAGVWRAIALLMEPWCAEGEVPTAANLNLYRGWNSCAGWHCDDEPLFGEYGDAKLIVSVSLGSTAVFRWMMKDTCAVLAMLTFLSWVANVRTSFFIVRIPVGNRNG